MQFVLSQDSDQCENESDKRGRGQETRFAGREKTCLPETLLSLMWCNQDCQMTVLSPRLVGSRIENSAAIRLCRKWDSFHLH